MENQSSYHAKIGATKKVVAIFGIPQAQAKPSPVLKHLVLRLNLILLIKSFFCGRS